MTGSADFVVWVHRSAESIFGEASHPANRNGVPLTFSDEQNARLQCDRLNAVSGSSHVWHSVEDILNLTPDLAA